MKEKKPRNRSRVKKVSYVLQVQCDKLDNMNEPEFLAEVRKRLYAGGIAGEEVKPISFDGTTPKVSVIKRVEEYLSAKDQP